ncbi:tetratricopeptide repeat protein [Catenovulum sp. SM1970]|uniref:tetratricopeptide repeat protein n=1 Tax=Marinifaba aquimaris TaxID=2741323 RepID=UPI0015727E59|nr:tetratricopeptide repeat protein [Marinifaba aquimaris]NTS76687.1 tetratricopeptide repeat protein [Marinifaba aquimaris]
MQVIKTLAFAFGFIALLSVVIAADSLFSLSTDSDKHIAIEQLNDEVMEQSEIKPLVADSPLEQTMIDRALERHQQGFDLLQQSVFETATELQKQALVDALITQLMAQSSYQVVIKVLNQLTESQRLAWQQQFSYAISLARTKQQELAIEAYRTLLVHNDSHTAAAINLGLLLNKAKRYKEAQRTLKKAVAIAPSSKKAKALSALATSLQRQNKLEKAAKAFAHSLEYRPNHAATWLKLALVKVKLDRDYAMVSKTFERAIALKPGYVKALKHQAEYQLMKLNFNAAINYAKQALALASKDEDIHRILAWAYLEQADKSLASEQWKWLASQANSKNERLMAQHINAMLNQREVNFKAFKIQGDEAKYATALLAKEQAEQLKASQLFNQIKLSSDWFYRAQRQLLSLTKTAEQKSLLSQLATENVYQAESQLLKAQQFVQEQEFELAIGAINQAIQLDPGNSQFVLFKIDTLNTFEQHHAALAFISSLKNDMQSSPLIKRRIKQLQKIIDAS